MREELWASIFNKSIGITVEETDLIVDYILSKPCLELLKNQYKITDDYVIKVRGEKNG